MLAALSPVAGCGRTAARPPVVAAPSAPPVLTVTAALDLLRQYSYLVDAGHLQSAYALWAPAWQAAHPEGAWASAAPLPAGANLDIGTAVSRADGSVYVPVRAVVSGSAGQRWADGGYTVAQVGGVPRLEAGGLRRPVAPQDLQQVAVQTKAGGQTGTAACGPYSVDWSVTPGPWVGAMATSKVTVTAGGKAVAMPALPAYSFGTFPTACGDLLDDGGTELVLTTATTTRGAYRQAAVYELKGTAVRLLGSISSVGDASAPRPVSPDGLYPYAMLSGQIIDDFDATGPVVMPVYWVYNGLAYTRQTADFPGALQSDLAARLARLRGGEHCADKHLTALECGTPDIVGAYYDDLLLGRSTAGIAALDAVLPPADHGWLATQARIVRYNLAQP